MAVETERRRKVELRKVEAALARIDDEDFGLCRECAQPIAQARLAVDPGATLCIRCADQAEQRQ